MGILPKVSFKFSLNVATVYAIEMALNREKFCLEFLT
jgi:hypothetical protein